MSLMSDVTHQVKHPPTGTIHSPFTGGLFKKCVQIKTCYVYASSSLVGSSSSGSEGVEEGLRTDCSAGNVVESCLTSQ